MTNKDAAVEAHEELNEILEETAEEVVAEVEQEDPEKLELMKSLGLTDEEEPEEETTVETLVEEPESPPEDPPEDEKPQEDPEPFEDRFKALTADLEDPETDPADPETILKQTEQQLKSEEQALQQYDFSGAVPPGITTEQQLNDHVVQLRDSGNELEAERVLNTYSMMKQKAQEYTQRLERFQQAQEQFVVQRHQVEWDKAQKQWVDTIPEVEPYIPELKNRLLQKMQSDPSMEGLVEDFNGKMKAVLQVYRELDIANKISKEKPKAKIKTPSAPDANVVSKKVRRKGKESGPVYRRSELAKMKYTDVDMDGVFAAMKAGQIIDDL